MRQRNKPLEMYVINNRWSRVDLGDETIAHGLQMDALHHSEVDPEVKAERIHTADKVTDSDSLEVDWISLNLRGLIWEIFVSLEPDHESVM